eukprot:gene11916-15159_t
MSVTPALVWFRQDLRLQDNRALAAALERGGAVLPVYILDDHAEDAWPMGGASRWWLHHALAALDASLRERGSRLLIARGDSAEVIREVVKAAKAGAALSGSPHAFNRAMELRQRHQGARVLLVEDNPVNREVATELLRRLGLHVDTAAQQLGGHLAVDR